jgi:hypothetical protein
MKLVTLTIKQIINPVKTSTTGNKTMSIQKKFSALTIQYNEVPDIAVIDLGSVLITHSSGRNYLVDIEKTEVSGNQLICSFDGDDESVQEAFENHSGFNLSQSDLNPSELTVTYFLGGEFIEPVRATLTFINNDCSYAVDAKPDNELSAIIDTLIQHIKIACFAKINEVLYRITGHDAEQLIVKSNDVCLYVTNEDTGAETPYYFDELITMTKQNNLTFLKLTNC